MSPAIRLLPSLLFALALVGCGDSSTNSTPTPVSTNGITVISPNGGETFQVGGAMRVQWSSTNTDFTSARLLVGCGNGEWYDLTSNSVDPSVKDTSLTIPETVYSPSTKTNITFPASSNCKVKIADYVISSYYDTSDASFTIKAK
jgi:hypothetical protein